MYRSHFRFVRPVGWEQALEREVQAEAARYGGKSCTSSFPPRFSLQVISSASRLGMLRPLSFQPRNFLTYLILTNPDQ